MGTTICGSGSGGLVVGCAIAQEAGGLPPLPRGWRATRLKSRQRSLEPSHHRHVLRVGGQKLPVLDGLDEAPEDLGGLLGTGTRRGSVRGCHVSMVTLGGQRVGDLRRGSWRRAGCKHARGTMALWPSRTSRPVKGRQEDS